MKPTDSVTHGTVLDYRNKYMIMYDGGGYGFPRWLRVRVVAVDEPCVVCFAQPQPSEPFRAFLQQCACGKPFMTKFQKDFQLCQECDRKQLAAQQRERRRKKRAPLLQPTCAACDKPMQPQRRTRSFCSPACRQANHRKQKRTSAELQRDTDE